MKARALIDFHPADPGGFLAALKEGDVDRLFREATFRGASGKPSGTLTQGSLPPGLHDADDCCVSLPLSVLDFRILTLPLSDPSRIAKVIPYELDSLALGGAQEVVFDVAVLRNLEHGAEVLVVYLRKEILQALLDTLSRVGIDPRAVTSVELRAALGESPAYLADFVTGQREVAEEARSKAAQLELEGRPVVNLRTGSFSHRRESERLWRTARVTAVLLFVLAALILAAAGLATVSARADSASARDILRKEYAALFPQERKVTDELYQLKAHLKDLRDKRAGLLGGSPLSTLKTLSENRVQGVYLTEMVIGPASVTLRGEAPSAAEVDSLTSRLAPHLPDLRVSDVKPITQGRTSFSLTSGVPSP